MALDYSTLSTEELEAIANNDYSKLSESTLTAIAAEPETKKQATADISVVPQAVSVGARLTGPGSDIAKTAYNVGKSVVGYPIDVAKNAAAWTPRSILEVVSHPQIAAQQYLENHPLMKSNASLASVSKDALGYAKNIGGRVLTGIAAPESAVMMPYQMAAYEQEKIRSNPNAPGLEFNPYAQVVRGEAATQGRAGAANQMRTVANQPYGNVNAQERAILDEDRRRREMIRQRAYERVMGPVAPGSF